jgi:hypothetical protein
MRALTDAFGFEVAIVVLKACPERVGQITVFRSVTPFSIRLPEVLSQLILTMTPCPALSHLSASMGIFFSIIISALFCCLPKES